MRSRVAIVVIVTFVTIVAIVAFACGVKSPTPEVGTRELSAHPTHFPRPRLSARMPRPSLLLVYRAAD